MIRMPPIVGVPFLLKTRAPSPPASSALSAVFLSEFQLFQPSDHFRSEPPAQQQRGDRRARAADRDVAKQPQRLKAGPPTRSSRPVQQLLAQVIKHSALLWLGLISASRSAFALTRFQSAMRATPSTAPGLRVSENSSPRRRRRPTSENSSTRFKPAVARRPRHHRRHFSNREQLIDAELGGAPAHFFVRRFAVRRPIPPCRRGRRRVGLCTAVPAMSGAPRAWNPRWRCTRRRAHARR